MLDIIFISYDEPNAEKNWRALKSRFSHAMRVHCVKGIAEAHFAAAKKANTEFFYVVDADAEVLESFKFDFKPDKSEAKYVHIWHAFNPVIGMAYGYGGVKLFHKKMFRSFKSNLDFSMSISSGIKLMDEIACITKFNSDPFRAYRGAFRETVKLFRTAHSADISSVEVKEARDRLAAWFEPVSTCDFRDFVVDGAVDGMAEAKKRKNEKDLLFINDHDLILSALIRKHPEIDLNTDPLPGKDNPMKHEFFFTTRISAILYDSFVLENIQLPELRDALSDGQLLSKNWLVEVLNSLLTNNKISFIDNQRLDVAVLGGWIGLLPLMMHSWEMPFNVVSIDINERSNRIAEKINYDYQGFSTMTLDMYDVDYSKFDVIINTSSEHIPDIPRWRKSIPENKLIVVQNNDFEDGDGHVSTVKNSNQLKKLLKLKEVFYEGTKTFPQYSRFMIIGRT